MNFLYLKMIFIYFLMVLMLYFLFFNSFNIMFFLESKTFLFNIMTDYWTKMFFLAVLFITIIIFIYCKYYMKEEYFLKRFLFLVLWFVLSMGMLLSSNNFFTLFIGWDGLGVSSYFLVIYYQNWKSMNAGLITILSNRIGDCLFMLLLSMIMFNLDKFSGLNFLNFMMSLFFLIICLTKSAQFPFSAWLPAAMAAPTPVSSLVHSSTLVTAGFYLMFRFSLYNSLMFINYFIMLMCFITLLYAGLNGLLELDFKKIIALSTLSQISLMFISLSIEMKIISFFHLFTHAFFKSLLFISVGCIIHYFFNNQDLRKYNFVFINILKFSMMFSLLSLMGLIFSSGFYSKDFILEKMFMKYSSIIILWMFFLMMFLTMFYSLRLFNIIFFININNNLNYSSKSLQMMMTMVILSIFSLLIGNFLLWNFINLIFLMVYFKMKMFIFLLLLNSILFFMFYSYKFFLNFYIINSMLLLTKMSTIFLKMLMIFKKSMFLMLEKSFMEVYESLMTYKLYNLFSFSIIKMKFIFIIGFLMLITIIFIFF